RTFVPLDNSTGEQRYRLEPAESLDPEALYDLGWARTVFEQDGKRLSEKYRQRGQSHLYQALRACLTAETNPQSYAQLGGQRECAEGTVKSHVLRLRRAFQELIREEVANTVIDPVELDEEFGYLIGLIGRWG